MKYLLSVSVLLFGSNILAANEWKLLAESINCSEKIQIFGKQGEKFVLLKKNSGEIKLFSKDGSAFHDNKMESTEYISEKSSPVVYSFIQPSYVEANPPKIDFSHQDHKQRCQMRTAE